jgi:cation diffusion facilitator CzcD-associated flavoprotein CzcO
VPRLAEAAKELLVFQRTPGGVGVRNNKLTDPDWVASLQPGWQADRIRNFTELVTGAQPEVDLIDDAWTKMLYVDTKALADTEEAQAELERIDFANMEAIRARIEDIVDDPVRAEALKPWYNQGCKRPCFHDDYLPAFNRPNVTLVDTDGKGVERITPTSVVVAGVEYPVDCLVFASGFEVTTEYTRRLGFDPHGKDGLALSTAWSEGPATLHGVHTRGFPNLLMISTVQGGQAVNFLHPITGTAEHVALVAAHCLSEGIEAIEPTVEAQNAWLGVLFGHIGGLARYNAMCTPGYLNSEGGGDIRSAKALPFMGSAVDFIAILERWREAGDLAGLEVTRA